MKERAILCGPYVGELGWELLRFAPYCLWKKVKQHKSNVKLIVLTRKDRFDLYGKIADILVPLEIEGDFSKYRGNCFRLDGYPLENYEKIIKRFNGKYNKKYQIIDHIYPKIAGKQFTQKNQFPQNQLHAKFKPRVENKKLVDKYLSKDKPWVVISPRFRKGFRRNWNHWQTFYDMIWDSDLPNRFEFIIIGRSPEYKPDEKNRFFDINKIPINDNSSLIGLTISIVYNSVLTVGSQSAIPNLSLLLSTDVLEWGNQRMLHTKTYNYTNTPITFLDDMKFNLDPKKVFNTMNKLLKKKG